MSYYFFISEILIFFLIIFLICWHSILSSFLFLQNYPSFRKPIVFFILFFFVIIGFILLEQPQIEIFFLFGLRNDFLSYILKCFLFVFLFIYWIFVIFMNSSVIKSLDIINEEFIILCLSLFWSSLLLVGSNDFLNLFLCIDFQAICLFILIAYNKNSMKSTESSWKYFIQNGFGSSLLLFGIAFFFFAKKSIVLTETFFNWSNFYFQVSIIFVLLGFLIKIGISPFHFWFIEVVEGSHFSVLPLVLILTKFSQFGILFYLFKNFFFSFWQYTLFFGILSILWSSVQSLNQLKWNRILAFLSIYSSGIVLMMLSLDYTISMFYLFVSNLFMILLIILVSYLQMENIFLFERLFRNKPMESFCILLCIVSILGIPPFIVFFLKLFLLNFLWQYNYFLIVFIFLLFTLIFFFIFSNIIKRIFFDIVSIRIYIDYFILSNNFFFYILIFMLLFFSFYILVFVDLLWL